MLRKSLLSVIAGVVLIAAAIGFRLVDTSRFAATAQSVTEYVGADTSPLPGYGGGYVSIGGKGKIHAPAEPKVMNFMKREEFKTPPPANCSRNAIIYYAKKAPENFQEAKKGLLYGVRTHTNATAIDTPIGRFAGYNSCALVVSSIMRKAGCRWMRITANAKAVYDMAYRAGWRPTLTQDGGCIVAWNARWEGKRARIGRGIHSKLAPKHGVLFRHVGVTTGSSISVDNSGFLSRPSESSTYRPVRYEAPIYLCPGIKSAIRKRR